ncbi:unnamed protein product [Heterosigma akashiwo]
MKPKNVPEIGTRNGFRRFFQGLSLDKMTYLLHIAYQDVGEPEKRDEKIQKRLQMLR